MRNIQGILIPLLIIFFSSCKTTRTTSTSDVKNALFSIDTLAVYPDEFLYAYEKSNKNKGETEPIEDYLDLYVNFKLKVAEAKAEGIDTTEAYQEELNGYLEEIKKPYLTTEKVNKRLVEEAYDRLQEEINASHILIRVEKDAPAEDTLKAFQKILDIKDKLKEGRSFEALAREYSEDPSARTNNGLLGWFTAFQMVYPFESAAYQTKQGEISPIIRTQFGYHLVKVNNKRETLGRIKIAHIMKRFPPRASEQDSAKTKAAIEAIYDKLNEGENWFILATKESDDLNTKDQGGSLPWFGAGNLPPSLETVAFELEEKGEISQPVQSPFGWHILKLEEKRGVGSLESMEESLSRRVQRDQRSELQEAEVIKKLKEENNFNRNSEAYKLLRSEENLSKENLRRKELEMTLFSIADKKYSIDKFLEKYDTLNTLEDQLEAFEKTELIRYEENNLEIKYPEYALLRQEYKDGLLLFEIMNQKVWSRSGQDSVALKKFYEQNKSEYISLPELKVAKIIFNDTSRIKPFKDPIKGSYFPLTGEVSIDVNSKLTEQIQIIDSLSKTHFVSLKVFKDWKPSDSMKLFEQIRNSFNSMELINLTYSDENKIYLQLFSEANELLAAYNDFVETASIFNVKVSDNSNWKDKETGDYIKNVAQNGMIELNIVLDKIPPKQKSFQEARGEVMEDYQQKLEEEWIEELKQKYTVKVNEQVLNKIKSKIEE